MRSATWLASAFLLAGHTASEASASPETPEVEYTVELVREPGLEVRFALALRAAPERDTTLAVDAEWGGVEDAGDWILDVAARGAAGQALEVERASKQEWTVHAPPGEPFVATWRVAPNDLRSTPDPRVHYHTLLDSGLLHFIGHIGLLVPKHLQGSIARGVALRWKGFREAGWNVATSFGCGPRGFEATAKLDDVRHAVYLAGPDLRVYQVGVRGRDVSVAIAGKDWTFEDDDFVVAVGAIVETERAFFDDDAFPFYLVSMIPVGLADPQSRSLGGTGLSQSFALFLQPDAPLGSPDGDEMGVPHLLAHEMFHHWNGGVAEMAEPEQLAYWFSEGFTEFFARRLLFRAGYGGEEEYVRSLNAALKEYALSPARTEPNERIREAFWKDRDVGRLPYLRGDLVALLLDRELRRRSDGRRSLDDFMRDAVARGRKGEQVETDALLRRVAEWTDAAFAEKLRSIVVDGSPATLDPSTFEPCLAVETTELGAFDLGFDFDASREAKEARSVRAGSAAERAGLREGLPIVRWSVSFGRPEVPVEMVVRDGAEERTIRWLPQGDARPVSQVRPRGERAGRDCSVL